ncbi:hypothetical protein P7C71_g5685, partial [Lecanoromycetidae sp. Uapishka_2]
MSQEHNYGEDKPPINLSIDCTNIEPSSNSGHPISSFLNTADRPAAVYKASNDDSSDGDEKIISPGYTHAHEQAYSLKLSDQHVSSHTENNLSTTSSELQSSDIEKHPTTCPIRSNDLASINNGALSRTTSAAPHESNSDDDPYPEGGLRAYSVVLGSFCGMTASFGILNSVGTFQAYLSTHQLAHESPSAIGWIFSLYAFLTFFCGVQIGPIFDGKELWHFLITYSILGGVGTSLIFTPAIGAIAHFFSRRRAAMVGLATTGGSVSGVIIPLMLQRLFPKVGFRWATRVLAFVFLFLLVIANLLIRSNPKIQPAKNIKQNIWPDFRIYKHKVFALTTAGVFMIEWALFIPLSYISSYALAHGISPAFSYQLLSILNAGSFFGRWAPGYLADRFGRFNTMIATVFLCMISVLCVWLTCTPESGSGGIAQLIIFVLLFGFASGSNISLTPVCVGQLCNTEVFGRYYASLYTVVSFGCLTGIPIAGEVLSGGGGSYTGLIGFVGACYGLGLVFFVWARVLSVGWSVKKIY